MKTGLILINAYSDLESAMNQPKRLKAELKKLGVQADIKRNDFFPVFTDGEGNTQNRTVEYDFCIYLDKDKYVSAMLEKSGMRLFNSHKSIEICDDKMLTHIALSDSGVPMPETLAGLLCYDPEARVKKQTLDLIGDRLGYPMIAKASYGSLGKDVYKIDDRAQLENIAEKLKLKPHLFQKFIAESAGRDIRVIVIGGKVAAAMKRVSAGDFRSNLELGGHGEPFATDKELTELCERVARLLNLDYCGIDVLCGKSGYIVCEVNSNAFFGGIERVTGINIAEIYAKHIYKEMYE